MTSNTQNNEQAQEIINAMREISDSEELRAEAATNPESVLSRLGLSGIARHAVALGIAGFVVASQTPPAAAPQTFWA